MNSFLLPLAFLCIGSLPNNFDDLLFVKVVETFRSDDITMVFFCKQEAGISQPFTIKGVSVLEDLADALHSDELGKNLLAASLDAGDVESVSELY